jgi:hypothetical protein
MPAKSREDEAVRYQGSVLSRMETVVGIGMDVLLWEVAAARQNGEDGTLLLSRQRKKRTTRIFVSFVHY